MFEENPDSPWDFQALSSHSNITMEFVNSNKDKPWDYRSMSCNPNLTIEFVNANLDKSEQRQAMGFYSFDYES
ncbi:hypothetical protein BDK51DRAFT_47811 [Blyttiomyces helicus]|uniref:Uncharacterized protein n=1 Tax=Blyttiomyces helicus TaxID=388810 RepID=A0A4P9W690_9FUNG|nr:hypothetical protein BDK51DRAFT_47811 [Blyttiomyces helicus]|eukprot:RKO85626.1 hypothetical protein BDK51DRAFT_47811 [Blyttiomyces helicus]